MDFDKLSRRDFLKKTTVLAVGVASATLFSGLVNAETYTSDPDTYKCKKLISLTNACTKENGKWVCQCEDGIVGTCTQEYKGTETATMTCES